MRFKRLAELELRGKRVFIRADFNVPMRDGRISDDTRIRASLPAIRGALAQGAAVMVTSHLGRPKEGVFDERESLAPVAQRLSELIGFEVPLVRDWIDGVRVEPGKAVLLENCRFNKGEKADDEALARKLAALCDVYVNDAFGAAHRKEASLHGMARFAKIACAGPLLAAELDALSRALANPARPLVAIVGGAKVSTKLTLLAGLAPQVDCLIVGGCIANTFLLASGLRIGKSLAEPDLVAEARQLIGTGKVPLPVDVVVAPNPQSPATIRPASAVGDDEMILDIGPQTAARFAAHLEGARTIVWNGPLGVYEIEQFAQGTERIARAIAESHAFSIAGGGETVAAIHKFGVAGRIGYISTAGGAFLEFLEGRKLPAVAALEERA